MLQLKTQQRTSGKERASKQARNRYREKKESLCDRMSAALVVVVAIVIVHMGVNHESRQNKRGIAYSQDDTKPKTLCLFFVSSVVQCHGVTPFHSTDHVRPFPHENELEEQHQRRGERRGCVTYHVRIRRRARGVREHLFLRDDAHLRVVVLEPRIRV